MILIGHKIFISCLHGCIFCQPLKHDPNQLFRASALAILSAICVLRLRFSFSAFAKRFSDFSDFSSPFHGISTLMSLAQSTEICSILHPDMLYVSYIDLNKGEFKIDQLLKLVIIFRYQIIGKPVNAECIIMETKGIMLNN